jgi:short-subunit dehydrogenase
MRQRRSGLILNISSGAGRMAVPPFFGFYAASKHAVEGYSEALSSDLRPLGIRVALIEPGYFATNIHNSLNLPANPLDDYAVEREHAMAVDNFSIRHGHNPRKAAQLVSRLVNRTPRRLRYPIWLELHSLLLMRSLLPARTFEGALRWLTLGGQPVKTDDDDAAIRRKIGFRRYMLESRLSSRLILGSGAALVLFLLAGLFFLLWPRA